MPDRPAQLPLQEALAEIKRDLPPGVYQLHHDETGWHITPAPEPEPEPKESVIVIGYGQDRINFLDALAAIAAGKRDVTWIENMGQTIAAIIPARNYHPPDQCCCKNCPWKGNHG